MERGRGIAVDILWLVFWGACSSVWCIQAAWEVGPTYDEPYYVEAGLTCWHDLNHKPLLCCGTMPLPIEVATFPLVLAEGVASADPAHDLQTWLPYARMGALVFWWLLLGTSFAAGRLWGGKGAGRLAVALVACEPILLGHASLAGTDLAFAACLLTLIVLFRLTRDMPSPVARTLLCSAGVALTLLSKASGLVYVPVCLLVLEAERLGSSGWRPGWKAVAWRPVVRSAGKLLLIGVLGAVFLFVLCPRAMRAFVYQAHHQMEGMKDHGLVYLLGKTSPTGFWYYFPAALLIKLSLPVLALLILVLILRPRYCLNAPLALTGALLALSTTFNIQIGVRYVLPIAVLGIVGGCVAFARWWREPSRTVASRWNFRILASGLVLWSLVNAWTIWPHGLCYTNELWGGTKKGYLALSDSNYDWGQGLKELAAWQKTHARAPLNIWYFGMDPLLAELPMHSVSLTRAVAAEEVGEMNRGRFLAVSTTWLYGPCYETPAARTLRGLRPCDRTTTYLIYDFTGNSQAPSGSGR